MCNKPNNQPIHPNLHWLVARPKPPQCPRAHTRLECTQFSRSVGSGPRFQPSG